MIAIEPSDASQLDDLRDVAAYTEVLKTASH
jgi:hypothetical protein